MSAEVPSNVISIMINLSGFIILIKDVIIKIFLIRSGEFMQASDEEKLNGMLGNISDFFHEIDAKNEEHDFRHGQTEFDSEKEHALIRKQWTAIINSRKKRKTKGSTQTEPENDTGNEEDIQTPKAAMKRFWITHGLSPEEIGRRYEIYIGYRYESKGWKVEYNGAVMGLEDSGIDLICTKKNMILLIQCKNWKHSKVIHEKYIHQLFGSASDYRINASEGLRVGAAFYTSASFSEKAKEIAEKFHIMIHEKYYLERFPCIKCKSDTHRYYIPDDPEYFTVSIDTKKGDMFCYSVDEAESSGFSHP